MNVSDIKKTVSTARRLFVSAEKKGREARIAGARATHAVYAAGLIGKNRTEKYGWNTAEDYAATLGCDRSNVPGLRSIGVALSVGFDPDGAHADLWPVLSRKAATAPVTEVTTRAESPDLAAIMARLREVQSGRVAEQSRTPRPGSEKKGEEKGDAVPTARNNSTRLDVIETMVAALDLSRLTASEFKRVAALAEALGDIKRPARKTATRKAS